MQRRLHVAAFSTASLMSQFYRTSIFNSRSSLNLTPMPKISSAR